VLGVSLSILARRPEEAAVAGDRCSSGARVCRSACGRWKSEGGHTSANL